MWPKRWGHPVQERMLTDDSGRTLIYDAFVCGGILYLVSTYYHYKKGPPLDIIVNGIRATEVGLNEYEPVRYFHVPIGNRELSTITINGKDVTAIIRPERLPQKPKRGGFAVATLFKYDHAFIPDMLRWYRAQGCVAFYLYFNGPGLPSELPVGEDIHYRLWNFRYWNPGDYRDKETGWLHAAQTAFMTTVRLRHMPEHDWTALVDIDEHIMSKSRLADLLAEVPPEIQVVRAPCHWARRDEDGGFTYAATPDPRGVRSKCIYRGSYCGLCGVHNPKDTTALLDHPELQMLHITNYWWGGRRADKIAGPLKKLTPQFLHRVGVNE